MTELRQDGPLDRYDEIPRFDHIRVEDIVAAVRALIARQDEARERLERELTPTWEGLAAPLMRLAEPLSYAWNVVHHLLGVKNSPALREAQEAVQGEVVGAALRLGQSREIYRGLVALRDDPGARLDPAQRRIVETGVREAELAGVGLEGEARERFLAIETELAEASTRFANNVLDATKAYALVLTTDAEIAGLPPSLLAAAAQSARAAAEAAEAGDVEAAGGGVVTRAAMARATPAAGPWRITLEAPLLVPFLEHSRRRDLRERLYRAHIGGIGLSSYLPARVIADR